MTAITIGYARCSTDKQDLAAQKQGSEPKLTAINGRRVL
jgi:DNA invertase Pin-like site-specific DNA recombinase